MVGEGTVVIVAVGAGGIGEAVVVLVGVGTAETLVTSFEATELSDGSVALSQEVNMMVRRSKRVKLILLVIVWSGSFFLRTAEVGISSDYLLYW
jgi:hypothetical protein